MKLNWANAWISIKKGAMQLVANPRYAKPKGPIPGRHCLARDYADCKEFTHCPDCSGLEQIARTATWVDKNWQIAQDSKGTSPQASVRDRE